jgi:acetoin utilization deacetylase AcuC-like enzyme
LNVERRRKESSAFYLYFDVRHSTFAFSFAAFDYDFSTGPAHPERPDRIRAIFQAVRDAGLIASPNPFGDFHLDLGIKPLGISPLVELTPEAIEERWLLRVHPQELIDRVKHACSLSGILDQSDTPTEPRSFATALLAVGAAVRCCDAVMSNEVRRAFAAVRPPGHHAEPDRSMGFCLFSNIAIAAKYLQQAHDVKKIAIVDFDVHHGNGTQTAFESDPTVLFISLHQDPRTCYPGSGYAYETGIGPGAGFTLNIPFQPGSGNDEYFEAMRSGVIPALDSFAPEFLLISAGFDAHHDDPLAQIQLDDSAYETITKMLVEVADRHCKGRIVSLLEGGYNLGALGRGVVRHLVGLIGP